MINLYLQKGGFQAKRTKSRISIAFMIPTGVPTSCRICSRPFPLPEPKCKMNSLIRVFEKQSQFFENSDMAIPLFPLRPVRPTRCTYSSTLFGKL
ncbi:hypothetical protein T12_11936 [Trichinella patagoniensis]|uniref:Uncharacterized protein n=1 Tax=Trichinella patagoniensis TaxID=990121 RepID=A0A0V1AGH6_9BILA|nr:hypothetical protein T12_11936 [Trichinella patagoniensis]